MGSFFRYAHYPAFVVDDPMALFRNSARSSDGLALRRSRTVVDGFVVVSPNEKPVDFRD